MSCENCHWKVVKMGKQEFLTYEPVGYCRINYEYIYAPRKISDNVCPVQECITYEMAELDVEQE